MHRLKLVRMYKGQVLKMTYVGSLDRIPRGWSIQCRRVA